MTDIPSRFGESLEFTSTFQRVQQDLSKKVQDELSVNLQGLQLDTYKTEEKLRLMRRNDQLRQIGSDLQFASMTNNPMLLTACAADFFGADIKSDQTPDFLAIRSTIEAVKPIAQSRTVDQDFLNYFNTYLQGKYSEALLEEALKNKKRQGLLGILFNEHTQKDVTKDQKVLKKAFLKDVRKYEGNKGNKSEKYLKVKSKDYALDAQKLRGYYKSSEAKKPNKKVAKVLKLIEQTENDAFDKERNQTAIKNVNKIVLVASVFGLRAFDKPIEKVAQTIDHELSKPDGDPVRTLEASTEMVQLGANLLAQNYLSDSGITIENTLKYLDKDKERYDGFTRWFLTDCSEALEHFPKEDRERLIQKSIDFVANLSHLYNLDDPDKNDLKQYLREVSQDKEMQDLLGYIALPFIAYSVEALEKPADEQWAQKILTYVNNGEVDMAIPLIGKFIKLLTDYEPNDNVMISFDTPKFINIDGETITIPDETIDALNALPQNPNYLPPDQYLDATEAEYIKMWKELYGQDSTPPQIHWSPDKSTPEYVRYVLDKYVLDKLPEKNQIDNYQQHIRRKDDMSSLSYFQSGDNKDAFTMSTIGIPDSFQEIYDIFSKANDPYIFKFSNRDMFFDYFKTYIDFIKHEGSPEKPFDESKLDAFVLLRCKGNLSEAGLERALLDKFLTRFDIVDGSNPTSAKRIPDQSLDWQHKDQAFYRTFFLDENLPILMSINYQTNKGQDINEISTILLTLDKRLIDQIKKYGEGEWAGYTTGSKKLDLAELWGLNYHRQSQKALTLFGITNPSAVTIAHTIAEFPFTIYPSNFQVLSNENGSYKPVELAKAGVDDILLRKILKKVAIGYDLPSPHSTVRSFNIDLNQRGLANIGKIVRIKDGTYSYIIDDPNSFYGSKIYIGDENEIKLLARKGYTVFPIEATTGNIPISVRELQAIVDYGDMLWPEWTNIDSYLPEERQEATKIMYENLKGRDLFFDAKNMTYYERYGFKITEHQINKTIYSDRTDNTDAERAAYLGFPIDSPILNDLIEKGTPALSFEYYIRLSKSDREEIDKLYPKIKSDVLSIIDQPYFVRSEFTYSKEEKARVNNLCIDFLTEGNNADSVMEILADVATPENIIQILENSNVSYLQKAILLSRLTHSDSWTSQLNNLADQIPPGSDFRLFLAPGLIKADPANDNLHELATNILSRAIESAERNEVLFKTDVLFHLAEVGYQPPEELRQKIVNSAIINLGKQHEIDQSYFVFSEYSTKEELMSMLNRLYDTDIENYTRLISIKIASPINSVDDSETLNSLVNMIFTTHSGSNSKYFARWAYINHRDDLTPESKLTIYTQASDLFNEQDRFNLWQEIKSSGLEIPQFKFDREKFISDYPNAIFGNGELYGEFIVKNFSFPDFVNLFAKISKQNNFFVSNPISVENTIFDHKFFIKMKGYNKIDEKRLVQLVSDQIPQGTFQNIKYLEFVVQQDPSYNFSEVIIGWLSRTSVDSLREQLAQNTTIKDSLIKMYAKIETRDIAQLVVQNNDVFQFMSDLKP